MNDKQLITNIKNDLNIEESLNILYEKYSKVYYKIINSFFKDNKFLYKKNELICECKYQIYFAAMSYDENKKAKFSSYLGNKARWTCLNFFNSLKKELVTQDDFISLNPSGICVNKEIDEKEAYQYLMNEIENQEDHRIKKIFKMRYFDSSNNKLTPWRLIGEELSMSVQGCINIHNNFLKKINYDK